MSTSRLSKLYVAGTMVSAEGLDRALAAFISRMPESARDRNPPRKIGGHTGSGTGIARLKSPRVISARLASTRAETKAATTALTEMRFELGLDYRAELGFGSHPVLAERAQFQTPPGGHASSGEHSAREDPVRWDCP